ncbi:CHAT domain-containing protein [Streptomyces sp. IB2014 016-6]|uniref:CHAT domain-containing protein n=1 Tax=Streptomyces sp. IB2014 016-6 TaxID=2517818 RepID=UPI0011CB9723|nr:CHAT domain-containing protein [Streptomyces sp. IB2014 016-6]TXL91900.1 CHAT domain-containing protein [Streptomyces sp. IB2014 016-6]
MAVGDLLADLRRRIGTAMETDDAGELFTDGAERTAAALAADPGTAPDADACHVLGVYHWIRLTALPVGEAQDEALIEAVRFLAPVYDVDPEVVPEPLRIAFTGGQSEGLSGGEALELGLAVCRAYERGRHLPLLRRAVELFRTAIAGLFDQPRDRAMALNNLGHVLRLTYERTKDAGTLDEAVTAAQEAVGASGHPEHPMFLSNLGLVLLLSSSRDKDTRTLGEAVAVARGAVAAAPPAHPQLMMYRSNLGIILHTWADAEADPVAADEAIALTRATVAAMAMGDPVRGTQLHILLVALQKQYRRTTGEGLLTEAVAVGREAVNSLPVGGPARADALDRLAACLSLRFRHTGQVSELREAIATGRAGVEAAPADIPPAERARYLHNLSESLRTLAEHSTDPAAADEAVAVSRAAVDAAGEGPHGRWCPKGLGAALLQRYEYTGDVGQLVEAATCERAVVAALPADDPDRLLPLNNLGMALRLRYEAVGGDELLVEAIGIGRAVVAALPDGHPHLAMALSNLGNALARKNERDGGTERVPESLTYARAAVDATPVGHPDRPKWLNNLGMALQALSSRMDAREPLEEAVTVLREAVAALPEGHPHLAMALGNLGNALSSLFDRTGDVESLREAATSGRRAVDATPVQHAHRAVSLNNLSLILQLLSWHTGDSAPLREAVGASRAAVAGAADAAGDHPNRALFLGTLGSALQMSFQRTGESEEIAEAVAVCREGVAGFPDGHPHHVRQLLGLSSVLFAQALRERDASTASEAVTIARRVVEATPEDDFNRNRVLINLSAALVLRFNHDGDVAGLREAVDATREAVAVTPAGLPFHAATLNSHAAALHMLSRHTDVPGVLDEILSCSRAAARDDSAPVWTRIASYRTIAALADPADSGAQEALAAAEAAVALLPQIGLGALDLTDRGHLIGEAGSLAGAAAAAALNAGRPRRAVELLEQSRGVLTAESVADGGTGLDRLRSAAPDLAQAVEEVRNRRGALDRGVPAPVESRVRPEARAAARREAQAEWDGLLTRIRSLDGFSGFLAPPGAADLSTQAAGGPVVYVSAAPARCDALVLTGDPGDPVRVVPLGGLTEAEAVRRIMTLGTAIDATADPHLDPVGRRAAQRDILDVLTWLWDTVTEPVLTALGHTGPPAPGELWPRVWWCPVGLLAYLPLHAAGHHEDLADGSPRRAAPRTVLDRVVSSYTATVRGLARARERRAGPGVRTAIVAVPDAPDAGPLAGAATEAELLTGLVPGAEALPHPTRSTVLAALPHHQVAHFACHSEPHRTDPWRSRLILPDHRTDPLTVADIGALRLDGGLAFLSACNTTLTAPRLADEALHMTGAFQLAGYPHVVGTQWPVADRAAHQLATDFYARLTAGGTAPPDPALSPEALHHATRRLRAGYPVTPTVWAAHTHTGA